MKKLIFLLGMFSSCLSFAQVASQTVASATETTYKKEYQYVETWLQYLPAASSAGLALAGVQGQHCQSDKLLAAGMAVGIFAIINNALKYTIREERPDGSAFNSFPSGHTGTAFMGAELLRKEYGWGLGGGAYALSAGVGVLRVVHNRHYWWDAAGGAVIGILSTDLAYLLLPTVSEWIKLPDKFFAGPCIDPLSNTLCAQFAIVF